MSFNTWFEIMLAEQMNWFETLAAPFLAALAFATAMGGKWA